MPFLTRWVTCLGLCDKLWCHFFKTSCHAFSKSSSVISLLTTPYPLNNGSSPSEETRQYNISILYTKKKHIEDYHSNKFSFFHFHHFTCIKNPFELLKTLLLYFVFTQFSTIPPSISSQHIITALIYKTLWANSRNSLKKTGKK